MKEWPKGKQKLCLKTRIERQVVERNKIMITCTEKKTQCFHYTLAPETHTSNYDNFLEMSKTNNSGQFSMRTSFYTRFYGEY